MTTVYRILHPKRDNLSQHIREEPDGHLTAVTETGQFYLTRLRLNRPQLIAARLKQKKLENFLNQQQQMFMRLELLEQQLEQLLDLTAQYISGDADARTVLEALLASRVFLQD